jgi:hypothetical protein
MRKNNSNEQLYKTHLECAAYWTNTWQTIQTSIDTKLQQQMNTYYDRLNNKLDRLQQQQKPKHRKYSNHNNQHFYPRIKNLTNVRFNDEELQTT